MFKPSNPRLISRPFCLFWTELTETKRGDWGGIQKEGWWHGLLMLHVTQTWRFYRQFPVRIYQFSKRLLTWGFTGDQFPLFSEELAPEWKGIKNEWCSWNRHVTRSNVEIKWKGFLTYRDHELFMQWRDWEIHQKAQQNVLTPSKEN